MVLPGTYSVTLSQRLEGQLSDFGVREFVLKPLYSGGLVAEDRASVLEFQAKTAELLRVVMGANRAAAEIETRVKHLLQAVEDTPGATEQQAIAVRALNARMQDLQQQLGGDRTVSSRAEPVPMSLTARVRIIAGGSWESQSAVTGNYRDSFEIAASQFPEVLADLKAIAADLATLEAELEAEGAPWTPARVPDWSKQ
jgi:hypothetical protein